MLQPSNASFGADYAAIKGLGKNMAPILTPSECISHDFPNSGPYSSLSYEKNKAQITCSK
jgi:hypothetical protein